MDNFNHITSDIVINIYETQLNYKIIELDNEYDTTVVYFSSNGIYYPNTSDEFKKVIIHQNRFEWSNKNNQFSYAKKIIFVRDVFKQWYLKGINKDIDSIDKLANFIKREHTNKKLVLIGSSAGGYAAVVIGCLLNADLVYSFSGQFTLEPIYENSNKNDKNIIVYQKYKNSYNIENLIKNSNVTIFYFVCFNSKVDKLDIEVVKKTNINTFFIDCNIHGIPFHSFLLKYIFEIDIDYLRNLSSFNLISREKFARYFLSLYKYDYHLIQYIFNRILKKVLRLLNV